MITFKQFHLTSHLNLRRIWFYIYSQKYMVIQLKRTSVYMMNRINVSTMKQSEFHNSNCFLLPICLDNLELCKNKFPFFVLLQLLISFFIFPAQHLPTIAAVYISNCVKAGDELPVLFRPLNHIHRMGEQKGSATFRLTKKSIYIALRIKNMIDSAFIRSLPL